MTMFTEQITFLHKHQRVFFFQKRCESGGDGRAAKEVTTYCVCMEGLEGGRGC